MTHNVDPITLAVVRGVLETTQREMTLTLEKTARSSVFNVAHDYSNALFNHRPEMILQGQDIPIHLGGLIPAMKAVARFFGDEIAEGDVIYHNDPAYMGSHILDCCMYKPVFYKGELVFWAVCKGHVTDIGGPVPAGYNPEAKEIYAEGLRIPPVKLWEKGKPRNDVINFMLTNMRSRRDQEGDLRAQLGAVSVGERNLIALLDKYGADTVRECIDELMDMADRHMRQIMRSLKDGIYEGTAVLEDAGHGYGEFDDKSSGHDRRRQMRDRGHEPAADSLLHQFLRRQLGLGYLSRPDDVCAGRPSVQRGPVSLRICGSRAQGYALQRDRAGPACELYHDADGDAGRCGTACA